MNKTLKNIINHTIELQFDQVDFKPVFESSEYEELYQKQEILRKRLFDIIPEGCHEEFKEALDELENSMHIMDGIEEKYLFKQGVIQGLTDLKYLEELGQIIMFI